MARIWYCVHCGYEVERGGRCHNCKAPLTESPLEELAEGEVDDELGYRLNDWDDEERGQLIEALVGSSIRHRFEGDELVVSAIDEEQVDLLMSEVADRTTAAIEGAPDVEAMADQPLDPELVAAVTGLYDAARRLRFDPTDMVADTDVAEASASMFSLNHVYGVDADTWAAIGRVTRKLLGALGADEALEQEIADQSAILCRLLEPVVDASVLDGVGGGDAGEGSDAEPEDAEPEDAEPEDAEPEDAAPEDAAPEDGARSEDGADLSDEEDAEDGEDDDGELVYELDDWLPEERVQLTLLLERDDVEHEWDGSDLIVPSAEEERVDAVFDEVDRSASGELAAEDGDDEADYMAISELFGAADRVAGDPDNKNRRAQLVEAAEAISEWTTPLGMTDDQWWRIKGQAKALRESVREDASGLVVAEGAIALRDILRQFV